MWIPFSPIGVEFPEYGNDDVEIAKQQSAKAALCETLSWRQLSDDCWALVWPAGVARLYLQEDVATIAARGITYLKPRPKKAVCR